MSKSFAINSMDFTFATLVAVLTACICLRECASQERNSSIDQPASDYGFSVSQQQVKSQKLCKTEEPAEIWKRFRLTDDVVPLRYDLLLHPRLETDDFVGRVRIAVNATKPMSHFVLHANKLNITTSHIRDETSKDQIDITRTFIYEPNEFLVLEMKNMVPPGKYEISLNFSGSLVDGIVGFYKSQYRQSSSGDTKYLATTKFQPTYARRAFPCFDEPKFKSTFKISLVHTPDYIALSNMPVQETRPYENGSLLVTEFQESVPMVAYLACFIVCDFEYKEGLTSKGKKFRVYAHEGNINSTNHALDFGLRSLKFYEDYFGIEYVLPKQDMVAIPDYASGATEHWGIITFRETNILLHPTKSNLQNKQRVSSVISHEMAHMWFGNLVTMEWWDDLWLNEGFASYIEYKGVNDQFPEWDMLGQFVTTDLQPVMRLDSTISSHPIIQPVSNPDEITEIFDEIAYSKGASVLRMLESMLGEENFRDGVSKFLQKYKFGNARTEDLWDVLSSVSKQMGSNLDISTVMKAWTEKMGFPYITVNRNSKNASRFTATQNRFLRNEDFICTQNESPGSYVWQVPLSYITSDGVSGTVWLRNSSEESFEIPTSENSWVKFNVNQTGYYIVNYSTVEWERLTGLLQKDHQVLSASDRSNLLFDAFTLAEAGHLRYDVPLSMAKYLKQERNLIPWETAHELFNHLCKVLEFTDAEKLMKRYVKDLTSPLYKELEWNEYDDHLKNNLRDTILSLACGNGNKECLDTASMFLRNWTQGGVIPTAFRRLVYRYGMSESGDEKTWNYMWKRYLGEESPQERRNFLYGLSHTTLPALIHKFLEYSLDETKIRRQDFFIVVGYLAGNPSAKHMVWNFLKENWEKLVQRFTLNDRYFGRAVKTVCSSFNTAEELREMQQFFRKYPEAGAGTRRRRQALENVQSNIKWLQTYKEILKKWLSTHGTEPWKHCRLSPHITASHYSLSASSTTSQDRFNGSASITVTVTKPSDCIIVHASNLDILRTRVLTMENKLDVVYSEQFYLEDGDYFVTKFAQALPTGQYILYLEYEGKIVEDFTGTFSGPYLLTDII